MTTEENTCRSAHLTRIWLAHTGSLGFTVTVDSDELGVVVYAAMNEETREQLTARCGPNWPTTKRPRASVRRWSE